ncbi:MAG: carboxypeptidase regulatory-like domain-containing protein [Candidatus Hydrogenedentes bacterium]|nr:carboxypeptidase regulatory-like domain-containing protein [Candidatus Hydrogenedentota bacterium]
MTTSAIVILLATLALSQESATDSMAPIMIRVQSAEPAQPVQEIQYFRKAGELVKGSYWRTRVDSTPTSATYDTTPPTDWRHCETPDRLEIKGVEGKEVVFVRAPGFETRAIQIPDSSDSSISIDIELAPVQPISGVVVDEGNKGVPGAPIVIGSLPTDFYGAEEYNWDLKRLAVATTDEQGRFSVTSYPIRYPLLLTTAADGFAPGHMVISKPEEVRNAYISLHKPVTFAGHVQLPKGRVKQLKMTVILLTHDDLPYGEIYSESTTGGGSFSISGMPPGRAKLYISGTTPYLILMENHFTHEQHVDIAAGDSSPVSIYINN